MRVHLKTVLKLALVVLIAAGCVYLLRPGFAEYAEQREEMKRLTAQIEKLETERVTLEERMQKLEDEDPELTEKLAREKLHLSKPGETVFRFKED